MALALIVDLLRLLRLTFRSRARLAAENLFLRKQLACYVERKVRPKGADNASRVALVLLSRFVAWRELLRSYVLTSSSGGIETSIASSGKRSHVLVVGRGSQWNSGSSSPKSPPPIAHGRGAHRRRAPSQARSDGRTSHGATAHAAPSRHAWSPVGAVLDLLPPQSCECRARLRLLPARDRGVSATQLPMLTLRETSGSSAGRKRPDRLFDGTAIGTGLSDKRSEGMTLTGYRLRPRDRVVTRASLGAMASATLTRQGVKVRQSIAHHTRLRRRSVEPPTFRNRRSPKAHYISGLRAETFEKRVRQRPIWEQLRAPDCAAVEQAVRIS